MYSQTLGLLVSQIKAFITKKLFTENQKKKNPNSYLLPVMIVLMDTLSLNLTSSTLLYSYSYSSLSSSKPCVGCLTRCWKYKSSKIEKSKEGKTLTAKLFCIYLFIKPKVPDTSLQDLPPIMGRSPIYHMHQQWFQKLGLFLSTS